MECYSIIINIIIDTEACWILYFWMPSNLSIVICF